MLNNLNASDSGLHHTVADRRYGGIVRGVPIDPRDDRRYGGIVRVLDKMSDVNIIDKMNGHCDRHTDRQTHMGKSNVSTTTEVPVPDKRTYAVCCYMVLYDADGQAYIRRMLLYGVVRRRRTSVHTPYAVIWSCTTQISSYTDQ
ncbi:hypothetical protein DPMN_020599 [Dreissena polymorpha]|uniref:Uncharacterized protein n=1 Tax=Dreissena polymorpha TaxID=45954 RepID=A0A9D4NH36_DREPO|nr:hypothetical protein DPMN_020599 [Dreissena polymorpha]